MSETGAPPRPPAEYNSPPSGTAPKSQDVYACFIASKAPNPEDADEEAVTVEDVEAAVR